MSRWKEISRRVIADALATIPEGTDPKIVRKIVSAAYPFGERKMHPYKCWLAEVKRILGPREAREEKIPQVRFTMQPQSDGDSLLWLGVWCDWCRTRFGVNGCMMCVGHWQQVIQAAKNPQFQALRSAAINDPVAKAALYDWLEENLGSRCGVDS